MMSGANDRLSEYERTLKAGVMCLTDLYNMDMFERSVLFTEEVLDTLVFCLSRENRESLNNVMNIGLFCS